jgi:hypothetical protein
VASSRRPDACPQIGEHRCGNGDGRVPGDRWGIGDIGISLGPDLIQDREEGVSTVVPDVTASGFVKSAADDFVPHSVFVDLTGCVVYITDSAARPARSAQHLPKTAEDRSTSRGVSCSVKNAKEAPPAVPKDSERGSGVGGAAAGGDYLRIYLKDHDAEEAGRRLFAALGGHRCRESRQEKTWTVFSSERSEWAKPPQGYARANIPFGDRLLEVHIICTTTAVDAAE